MRVLYLSRGGNPHDRRFLSALSRTEHEVLFLPTEVAAASERKFIPENVALVEVDHSPNPDALQEVLARHKPDLIHAGPIPGGAFLAAQTGWHPLVSMSWGSDLLVEAQSHDGREAAEYTLRASDVLVCDCQAVRDAAIELGMPESRIVIFPWGIDLKRFSPKQNGKLIQDLGWEDSFVILSTRSWEPNYGVDLIVSAFIDAALIKPSLRLMLLGQGSQQDELVDAIEQAGLSDRVHVQGFVEPEALPAYYRAADLYISASHSDGTSVSLLESMACGVPALVSDIPSNQEWVVPGQTGWWFRDGDETALSSGILEAIATQQQGLDMGLRAREIAEDRADWQQNFAKLLEAYNLALTLAKSPL